MQPYVVGAPFERVAIDVLGPLPRSDLGNRYILAFMDYFTKWPECFAIPDQTAETVAGVLVDNVFSRHGMPLQLHSDQGRNFESDLFQEVMQRLGIEKTRTTPLHPQSDGMVERFNRTILDYLSKFCDLNQRDWDRHLPLLMLAHRTAVHETTRETPAMMVYGRELRLPLEAFMGVTLGDTANSTGYVAKLRETLRIIHELASANSLNTTRRMKDRYDLRTRGVQYNKGDRVWLYNHKRRKGFSPKLQADWDGPYVIVDRISQVVYKIKKEGSRVREKIVHFNRLAPFKQLGTEAQA